MDTSYRILYRMRFPDWWLTAWALSFIIWLYLYGIIELIIQTIKGDTLDDIDNTEADHENNIR